MQNSFPCTSFHAQVETSDWVFLVRPFHSVAGFEANCVFCNSILYGGQTEGYGYSVRPGLHTNAALERTRCHATFALYSSTDNRHKIAVLPDPPHLLKNMRNNMIKYNIEVSQCIPSEILTCKRSSAIVSIMRIVKPRT